MDARNPYAPSSASLDAEAIAPPSEIEIWRDRKVAVLALGSGMPHRCVKCNEPAVEPIKQRKLYWHHPALYLLLVSLLVYLIVVMLVRKRATVAPGLCTKHRNRRRTTLAVGWIGVIAGFGMTTAGSSVDPAIGLLGILVLLVSLIVTIRFSRIVYAKRIDKSYVRLKGCGPAFLDSLEPFVG